MALILWTTRGQVDTSPAKGSSSFQHWSNWQQTPSQLDTSPCQASTGPVEDLGSTDVQKCKTVGQSNPVDDTSQSTVCWFFPACPTRLTLFSVYILQLLYF